MLKIKEILTAGRTGCAARGYLLLLPMLLWTAAASAEEKLTVLYAASFEPVMHAVLLDAPQALGCAVAGETGGSQSLMRKLTELGRTCDLLLLADPALFKTMGAGHFSWRLDFAGDELVLGVGIRARRVDEAEKSWVPVLLDPDVRLARADESMGPIGYRTLWLWQLREQQNAPGLADALKKKSARVVDDVGRLAALLKAGDVDYAFLYRTTAQAQQIRCVRLDPAINLGVATGDYSRAEVRFQKSGKSGDIVSVRGQPIQYGLSIPAEAAHLEKALALIRYLLQTRAVLWAQCGFAWERPRFHGPRAEYEPYRDLADYAGPF